MAQQRPLASRRRFLQGGAVGAIGGLLSGCLGDELETDGFEGSVEWQATFGGESGDRAESVIETSDGGYLFAGETRSFAEEDGHAWVVKLDSHGHEEWSYSIGGERRDMANSVFETSDGGYLFAGSTWSFAGEHADALLVKLTEDGDEEWRETVGGEWTDLANAVIETSDGGCLFAGKSRSFSETGIGAWIVKLNAEGAVEWSEAFHEKEWEGANAVVEGADGGYLLVGGSQYGSVGNQPDALIVKVDANGREEWRKLYGENEYASAMAVIATSDGGYLFAGNRSQESLSGLFDEGGAWVVKLDPEGDTEWSRTFGGEYFKQDIANSVIEASDGGYLFAGNTRSFTDEGVDAWIGKVSAGGNGKWRETFGDDGKDAADSVIRISDGGYLFAGQTESVGNAYWDAWVVKLT
jgi:uncharacterized protein (DUF1330 family)